jgi:DNA helicase HerA-like ATPase
MEQREKFRLNLGPLVLEDVLQKTIAVLGNKGAGKTNTLRMMTFQMAESYPRLPIYILDPLNVIHIYGFKKLLVGRKSLDKGPKVAQMFNEYPNNRIILSFTDMLQGEQNHFVNELFANWKIAGGLLAVDEIHDFCPQSGENYCFELERAVRHWRNRGAGDGFIFTSQRPAKVNKNILELCDVDIIMRMVGNNDQKAIEGYLSGALPKEQAQAVLDDLKNLKFLESYVLDFTA